MSEQPTRFDDDDVSQVDATQFGATLFNAYTLQRGSPGLLFSQRVLVVRRMLRAMLDAEQELQEQQTTNGPMR